MSDTFFNDLRDLIQDDIGRRGLATDPERNLLNACPDDLHLACRSLAEHPQPGLAIVTGFFIPTATPPAGETDGPLGALFLARALAPLGIPVVLVTDDFCARALQAGVKASRCDVPVVTLPSPAQAKEMTDAEYWSFFDERKGIPTLSHLLAIERVGPSHTLDAVPPEHRDRCHTMRGRDINDLMSPAHRLFEAAHRAGDITTIGIGDGGNELGMGKIPWDVIERNIPNGGLIACRIATHHLIVCGVSNWGAYALAAGVSFLRGQPMDPDLYDTTLEQQLLEIMVREGPLVDAPLGKQSATVDGLTWKQYADVLTKIGAACGHAP